MSGHYGREERQVWDPPEASRRRDEGLARVEENAGDWMEQAWTALGHHVSRGSGYEASWEGHKAVLLASGLSQPHHHNAWGALVRRAVKAGWLVRVGHCAASSPESHGREIRVYRVRS